MKNKILIIGIIILLLSGCTKKTIKEKDVVDTSNIENENKQEAIVINEKYFITINASVLNIRQEPNKDSKVLGKLVEGQKLETKGSIKDEQGNKWYEIQYKQGKGYIASWFCSNNKSINIDLRAYSGYEVNDIKWMDKDVIILINNEKEKKYKLLNYSYESNIIKEFYSGDKVISNLWDCKNIKDNKFVVCLPDRVLVFEDYSLTLSDEIILQKDDETNEAIVTIYDVLYDGTIVYVSNNNIYKKTLYNNEENLIYHLNKTKQDNSSIITLKWSELGTKLSSIIKSDSQTKLLIINNNSGDIKEIKIDSLNTDWLDDKYLFSGNEEKGYIINSETGKKKEITISKYIKDMVNSSVINNKPMVALFNNDSIAIIKDIFSSSCLKYSLKNDLNIERGLLLFNQIGNNIVGLKANKYSVKLYVLELY
ncbi:MAG: SH3 domain-containing protein [Vallitalea sp.]|jgi:uncharacterized protein YgiM (DUF1202 family)|nr:SH3 domain-containing protein [Vallitalea sp.]